MVRTYGRLVLCLVLVLLGPKESSAESGIISNSSANISSSTTQISSTSASSADDVKSTGTDVSNNKRTSSDSNTPVPKPTKSTLPTNGNGPKANDSTSSLAALGPVQGNISAASVQVEPSSGSANLSIPINVPPGRAGIQPNLAVVYNSGNRGLGNAGVGWSLDLGSIQISTKKGVPHYDGTDIYTMEENGATQDLVQDPTTATLYHMEVEGSFARIQLYQPNTANAYWVITDKKGIKYYYGNTADSIQNDPANPMHIFRWALNRVEDLNGNYMTVSYKDVNSNIYYSNSEIFPETISYTGNDVTGLAPYAEVSISYAAATQHAISYISQFLVETALFDISAY